MIRELALAADAKRNEALVAQMWVDREHAVELALMRADRAWACLFGPEVGPPLWLTHPADNVWVLNAVDVEAVVEGLHLRLHVDGSWATPGTLGPHLDVARRGRFACVLTLAALGRLLDPTGCGRAKAA
jgi:hypothetical protein